MDLIVRYRPRLQSLGVKLGLSRVQAEDLAQQVLLEAPSSGFEAREGATYFSWLAAIARRKAVEIRKVATEGASVRRLTTPWTATWRSEVFESIERMPEPTQSVFLRLALGYTTLEIARELGIRSTTVRMQIHRGRKWLRDHGH